jgi:hypothetical protein
MVTYLSTKDTFLDRHYFHSQNNVPEHVYSILLRPYSHVHTNLYNYQHTTYNLLHIPYYHAQINLHTHCM